MSELRMELDPPRDIRRDILTGALAMIILVAQVLVAIGTLNSGSTVGAICVFVWVIMRLYGSPLTNVRFWKFQVLVGIPLILIALFVRSDPMGRNDTFISPSGHISHRFAIGLQEQGVSSRLEFSISLYHQTDLCRAVTCYVNYPIREDWLRHHYREDYNDTIKRRMQKSLSWSLKNPPADMLNATRKVVTSELKKYVDGGVLYPGNLTITVSESDVLEPRDSQWTEIK